MGAIRVCGFAPKLADECLVSDFQAIFRCALQHASVNSRRPIGRLTPVNSVSHPFWHSPDRGASHVYSEAVLDNKAVVCHFVSVWMEAPVANPFATGASAFLRQAAAYSPFSAVNPNRPSHRRALASEPAAGFPNAHIPLPAPRLPPRLNAVRHAFGKEAATEGVSKCTSNGHNPLPGSLPKGRGEGLHT